MRTSCRLLSLLLLLATGCTYNPVRYDPCTGFQTGGGVGVLCGGPLDPWMQHCGRQDDCCWPFDCLSSLLCCNSCCHSSSQPVCPPVCPTPVCPPVCPAPVCPPIYPTQSYPASGIPWGPAVSPMTPLPSMPIGSPMMPMMPMSTPQTFGPPTPTFAEPCQTCAAAPSSGFSPYSHHPPNVEGMLPGTTNYPHLFQSPPMAPPAPPPADPFMMPSPATEAPPSADQMPPHYQDMDTPAGQQPPANSPMPQITPRNTNPPQQPAPMPKGTDANQTSYPQMGLPRLTQQGVVQPGTPQYDSRRQQWIPLRL
jgi:hypothetical protein